MRIAIASAVKRGLPELAFAGAAFAATRCALLLCAPDAGSPLWQWPLAAVLWYAYRRFARLEATRTRRLATVYALALIFFQLLGRQYDIARPDEGFVSAGGIAAWLGCLGVALLLAPALAWPLTAALDGLRKRAAASAGERPAAGRSEVRFFLGCVAALMLLWQPYHMAYWPGLVEYDSGYQLWQSWNGLYNASNPLLHTFILGAFYLTGEKVATATEGIAAFCVVQRLFMAGCIAWALLILRRNRTPGFWLALSLAFFGLFPVFPMLAISCTKDVPFYGLVLVQMCMIFDGCRSLERVRARRYWVALGAVTLLACLFRANALAAMFGIAPLICWTCRNRDLRRRLALVLTAGVALAWVANAAMVAITHADRPLLRESLSVPILQLARVDARYEEADADMRENYADLVQTPLTYISYIADLSKWAFTVDGGNLGRFAGLWMKNLARWPRDYLDALLLVNKGYWYIGDTTYARVYGDAPEQRIGAIPSRVTPNIDTIVEGSRLPGFQAHLERMYSANEYLQIPGHRLLLCPALYVWLLLFCLTACIDGGRRDVRIVARHALAYLAALLLGPCCIVRYALLLMLLGPVLPGMLMTDGTWTVDEGSEVRPFHWTALTHIFRRRA